MMLFIHISLAVLSLVLTGFTLIFPSKKKLALSCTLAAATLATGTALALQSPASAGRVCVSGLVYLALVAAGIVWTQKKLALQ